jgi:FkbM family methyltransferase
MGLRTKLIQKMIDLNERIYFYPSLRKFYSTKLSNRPIRILDVGSNKGQSIDFFLAIDASAQIIGFEPNQRLFNYLKKKYAHNSNIELQNLGVSESSGILVFNENVLDETSSFEELNTQSDYLQQKAKILGVTISELTVSSYEVDVVSLLDFVNDRNDLKHIDVLKIDVEGHEFKVLTGLFSLTSLPIVINFIQIEYHNDDMYLNSNADELFGLLNRHGYSESKRIKHAFGDFYEIIFERSNLT